MPLPTVVYVVGPTAAGKTGLAISLAQTITGEVISADSRQVYRGLDIGTAKVTTAEMAGVPHHLIDVTDINTVYTGADFLRDADAAISDIATRHRVPIVAGGTYFYVQLLRRQISPAPVPPDSTFRDTLSQLTTEELYLQLQTQDPARAHHIDPHNRRRLVRALEIVHVLGAVPPTTPGVNPYHEIIIGIDYPKEVLQGRYSIRAKAWLQAGIVTETSDLLEQGVSRARLQEIGFEYELVLRLLDKEITEDEYVTQFVQKNWQYAKRQRTWMYKDERITWFSPDQADAAIAHVQAQLPK